ncbi:MAG: hypothetical protein CMM47_00595 [Rhodospirillaceae bacterium]|nr:hypothetical protein [Rhodospirillaceae bacterium]MBM84507.1 hypothetical protein [Rhodospirillaceae bacterium]|tara:strand:- start:91 stop:777 length:687 start_codon:yes stop_codon:yes gene_type:complete
MSNQTVATKPFTTVYNFNFAKAGSDAFEKLQKALASGTITTNDVEVDAEKGSKRKPFNATLITVDMVALLADSGLSEKQVATVQDLVNAHIEAANKENVAVGITDYTDGLAVLEAGLAKRGGSIKVTKEMLAATIAVLESYLASTSMAEKAKAFTIAKATAKFTVASLATVKTQVVERMGDILNEFATTLDDAAIEQHLPVLELWADNIQKTLNPEASADELDESDFM